MKYIDEMDLSLLIVVSSKEVVNGVSNKWVAEEDGIPKGALKSLQVKLLVNVMESSNALLQQVYCPIRWMLQIFPID